VNQATRKEKEKLLRTKMTELQTMWGNRIPLDDNWRHLHELTDERLDEDLTNTIDQLRFEKTLNIITGTGKVALLAFVALGAVLLLFVIRQMF
jgi:ligand-binding SRPBCC domain-containing protein